MTKFVFITSECGDWQALYINGELAVEGHSISAKNVLYAIANILPNKVESYEIPDEVAEMGMPTSLKNLFDNLSDY